MILLALLMAVSGVSARKSQVEKMYVFGLAASFTDTIVHFTPIMEVDSAWFSRKKSFLMGREEYSYQLRDYLATQLSMPQRTCIVVYGKKLKAVEKKRAKMLRLYTEPPKGARQFDVRYIEQKDFRFKAVNMRAEVEQQEKEAEEAKAAGKKVRKDKKEKADKKKLKFVPQQQLKKEGMEGRRLPRG